MKKIVSILSVFTFLLTASWSFANEPVKIASSNCHIQGSVSSSSGTLLTNAKAYIQNSSTSIQINRRNATFDAYVPNNSVIVFECNGYVSQETDPITSDQTNMSVVLQSSSSYSSLTNSLVLPSYGDKELKNNTTVANSVCQIKGKVTNSNGTSLTQSSWRIENSSETNPVNRRDASFSGSVPFNSRIVFECSGYSSYTSDPITSDQTNLSIVLTSESDFSTVVINLNLK